MSDDGGDNDEEVSFLEDLEDLASHLSRAKAIPYLAEFFAGVWDGESDGPPALDKASSRELAFYLHIADRWDDLVEYLQAIWDSLFNDVPTRGDDQPRLLIGSIHEIKVPEAGAETWELSLAVEDSYTVITHSFLGWQVTATGGTV